ncbi:MAG TPA: (d)CMP kinase [Dehalococcoidia bacterium]|nr:(d)CMP kinase [Dehalococcoidia bacterium]
MFAARGGTYNRSKLSPETPNPPSASSGAQYLPVIAIDGPVASGKSAVGLMLARQLGYRLVDTGMMYRAITWLALQRGVSVDHESALVALAENARIELGQPSAGGGATLRLNGEDVTSRLRTPDVDRNVSFVSRLPGVRAALVRLQRALAAEGRLVMLGRDIGSVVLTDAPLKVYLDASAEVRAKRRYRELADAGRERPEEEILEELRERDRMDSERHESPLRAADGALIIDTSDLTLEQVVERVREAALVHP